MCFIASFFSTSPLHVSWLLPYIIKNNTSEGLSSSTTNYTPCLDQCNGKIKLITHLCCPCRTNYRSSHQKYLWKKVFLEISQNSQEKACTRVTFLNKVAGLQTLVQVLSCEFREISKNTFFREHLWATASIIIWIFTYFGIVIVSTKFVAQSFRTISKAVNYFRKKVADPQSCNFTK